MLEVRNVQVSYGVKRVLQPTSLQIKSGQIYGLIGHNGSGKSTLLKVLAGQIVPTAGQGFLNGKNLLSWRPSQFAREVAYLPQHLPISGVLTVEELVSFGRYPWIGMLGRMGPFDKQQIEKAMLMTRIEHHRQQRVDTLSGGERQRVWLAMLLAQNSSFLLLDEPLAALDIVHQVEVLKLIKQISIRLKVGIVLVLHDVNLAARYCDQLVAMRTGELIAQGKASDLMTEGQLKAIYGMDMSVIKHPRLAVPVALVN